MEREQLLDRARAHSGRRDLASVVAAGIFWGTGGLAGALLFATSGAQPAAVGALRLLMGGVIVTIALVLAGQSAALRVGARGWRRILTIGALSALYQFCYFAAVSLTSVSIATLVTLGSSPLLVVLGDAMINRRRPSRRILAALLLALTGLVLLVGAPAAGAGPEVLAGAALAVGSGAGFAGITLLGSRPVARLGPVPTAGLSFVAGGAGLAVLAAALGQMSFEVDAVSLGLIGYLGLVPTALAYALYFSGLRTVHPGPAALIALLEPLTAALLAAVFLGDRLGLWGMVGAAAIGSAVVLSRRG